VDTGCPFTGASGSDLRCRWCGLWLLRERHAWRLASREEAQRIVARRYPEQALSRRAKGHTYIREQLRAYEK